MLHNGGMLRFSRISIGACAAICSIFAASASAWTGPSASPPSGNVAAPINVSSTYQEKAGILGANGILDTGSITLFGSNRYLSFNSNADSSGYGLRDNSGTLEFKNSGGSWANLNTVIQNYLTLNNYQSGGGWTPPSGITIEGLAGRNYFRDTEGAANLRVGAAWGTPGIYAESGNVVVGAASGHIYLGQPGGPATMHLYGSTVYDTGNYLHLGAANVYSDGTFYSPTICLAGDCKSSWPGGSGFTGSGSTNYVPLWTGGTSLGNSPLSASGSNVSAAGDIYAAGRVDACAGGSCSHLRYAGSSNYLRGNTYFNGVLYDESNTGYYLNPDGTSITNDFRANIFYDNNNTGYYADPAATSNFNALYVGGQPVCQQNGTNCPAAGAPSWANITGKPGNLTYWDTWYGSSYLGSNGDLYMGWNGAWLSQRVNQTVTTNSQPQFGRVYDDDTNYYIDLNSVSYMNDIRPNIIYDRNNTGYFVNPDGHSNLERVDFSYGYDRNNTGYYIDLDNRTNLLNLTANGDIRSPIFYDQNDTSYYLDPSYVSYLNDIRPNIIYDRNNTGYRLDPDGTSMTNDFRANIFYDNNNTGYYLNPDSTSNLYTLYTNDTYIGARGLWASQLGRLGGQFWGSGQGDGASLCPSGSVAVGAYPTWQTEIICEYIDSDQECSNHYTVNGVNTLCQWINT